MQDNEKDVGITKNVGVGITAVPGAVVAIQINIPKNEISNFTVVLMQHGTIILEDIPLVENNEVAMFFVALSSIIKAGRYVLFLKKNELLYYPLEMLVVIEKKFKSEEVFVKPQTAKILKQDKEKIKQARFLWNLTGTILKKDVYQYDMFLCPIKTYKRISSQYGDRRTYKSGKDIYVGRSIHKGIDFSAEMGTDIYAPAKGKVVFADNRIVTGKTIVLAHYPGVYSLFYHMDEISVQIGQEVTSNDVIGKVGSTGFSTGSHLHWEVRVNNIQVNPTSFFKEMNNTMLIWTQNGKE